MIGLKGIPATTGGIERHVHELAPRLSRMGVDVTAYCRRWYSPDQGDFQGVRRIWKPAVKTKHLDAISHTFFSTFSAMAGRFDLLHFHALGPSSLSFLPRMAGRKVVATVHGLDYMRAKWGAVAGFSLRRAESVLVASAHRIIVVSNVLAEYFRTRYGVEPVVVPNGVPPPDPKPPSEITSRWGLEAGGYILSLGRLVAEKRVQDTLQAFARLKTDLKLAVVGDANFAEHYGARLREMAAGNDRIIFTGPVTGDPLHELLTNAAAFVQASELEGLPIALLEALSYSLPVVASDIPEHSEVLDGPEGPYGRKYPVGDIDALAESLQAVIDDPRAAVLVGKAGATHVARCYNWDEAARKTLDVYEEAMGEERS